VSRAALASCLGLPDWFRAAANQLADLANAPDRWRAVEPVVPALVARAPDHFFDLDVWGAEALPADRWVFSHRATRRGLAPDEIGFLPFAILEEYGVLVSAFRDVRRHRPGAREGALASAGVLAHLVGDLAVPLHVTRHHHGWVGRNPEHFTRDAGVHAWFETALVEGLSVGDLALAPGSSEPVADPGVMVRAALRASLDLVPRLYRCERRSRVEGDASEARQLVRERLAAGAVLLARVWGTAWQQSDT
jgi:hypothetical protein